MEYLVDAAQMKSADCFTSDMIGIPPLVLMERAALAMEKTLREHFASSGPSGSPLIRIYCGRGNNGADGLACARLAASEGFRTDIRVLPGRSGKPAVSKEEGYSDAFLAQYRILKNLGISVGFFDPDESGAAGTEIKADTDDPADPIHPADADTDAVVDAVCGTGLEKELTGPAAAAVREMERLHTYGVYVLAADIPSGISAADGHVCGTAVHADDTVTFAFRKRGHVFYPGTAYVGRVTVHDIGIPETALGSREEISKCLFTMDAGDLTALHRRPDGNKGTFGKALIIAGNRGSCGAALLSARAAFRAGAGMVRLFTPEANRIIVQESLPEAMLSAYDPDEPEETGEELRRAMAWADLTAAGPGMGTDRAASEILHAVLTEYSRDGASGKLVLDADALRMIAADETLSDLLAAHAAAVSVILTPHLGEFAALAHCTAAVAAVRRFDLSDQLALRYRAAVICKDARTLVTGEDLRHFMNTAGNDGMATAGSGDVLTGVTAALSMLEKEPFRAACFAVLVHALAGDAAAAHKGRSAMMAGDISEALQYILP